MNEIAARELINSPMTSASAIHAIIYDKYGDDAYDWDPVTISLELSADFDVDVETSVIDKWSAMQVIMTSDLYFDRLDAFLPICNTLASGAPTFQIFDPVTPSEAAWSLFEASLNREPSILSLPIKTYLSFILKGYGFLNSSEYPEIFRMAIGDFNIEPKLVRDNIAADQNVGQVDLFIDEMLKGLKEQFDRLDASLMYDVLFLKPLDEAVDYAKKSDN